MTLGKRTTAAACIAAGILLLPALAEAQRQAVPRPVPSRPVGVGHGGGYYRGPVVYRSYWANPYWYGGFYGGYGYSPFYFSVGFPCCGYAGYGYGYGYPYYGYGYPYDISASLRVQVTPREAQVFVDGYFAGTVDNFDGTFQRLHLEPGDHDLEVFMPGHRSYQQKVYLQPGKTFNVRHEMEPLGPGEVEPVRPEAKPRTTNGPHSSQRQPEIRSRDREPGPDDEPGREPASKSEFGSLALRVQPGDASVTIDGEAWETSGENNRLIVQLGPGVHTVQIRKDGYRTYMTDVTVRPGETTTLNVAMTAN